MFEEKIPEFLSLYAESKKNETSEPSKEGVFMALIRAYCVCQSENEPSAHLFLSHSTLI